MKIKQEKKIKKLDECMVVKSNYIAIFITLLFLGCICVWVVDNSVSAMLSGGYLSNGMFNVSALQMYHFGLYGILGTIVFMCIVLSHYILVGRIHSDVSEL